MVCSAACGYLNAVQALLESDADVMAVDRYGNSALIFACLNGQDDVIDELLAAGGDLSLNAPNLDGLRPIHFAAATSNGTACLEALVAYQGLALDDDSSADYEPPKLLVNVRDKYGRSALHLAAKLGHAIRVQELLRFGAEVNASDLNMQTPLHYAVRSGHTQVIDALVNHGADVNNLDSAGMSSLHHAAFYGLTSIVRALLKKSANPLIHDITGRFPHFLAAYSGNVECLQLLFPSKYGQYLTSLDNFNRSPLHYAAAAENDFQCLQYLLELRKKKPGESNGEHNHVDAAPSEGDEPLFNVNQSDIFGRTPLMYAAASDDEGRKVDLLLRVIALVRCCCVIYLPVY